MIILGIDPGLNATGFGVIAVESQRIQLMAAGAIRPPARAPLAARLRHLADALRQVMTTHQPTLAVLEALYVHHTYLTTAALMGHARGVACLVSAEQGLDVVEYLPTRVKKAVTGYGAATKDQVARAVEASLGLERLSWSADATDALALAIAQAHIGRMDRLLRAQAAAPRRRIARLMSRSHAG